MFWVELKKKNCKVNDCFLTGIQTNGKLVTDVYPPKYYKLKIIVFTSNDKEMQKYFNLFKVLLGDKVVGLRERKEEKHILTGKADIIFYRGLLSMKGHKSHYVLNLTQDKEFHERVAEPMTINNGYLRHDDDWSELFTNL